MVSFVIEAKRSRRMRIKQGEEEKSQERDE